MSAATTRDTNQTNHPNGNGNGDGPRRSSLVQERSRRTRRELVNAAVKLWTERGFESGVESTTVEEIARAAGVTKGTFYFHFAHKEDVLLEMSNAAGDAAMDVARRSAEDGELDRRDHPAGVRGDGAAHRAHAPRRDRPDPRRVLQAPDEEPRAQRDP